MNNMYFQFKTSKCVWFLVIGLVLSYSVPATAAVNLPWSITYNNCADWQQGQALTCDGLETYGGWTTSNGSKEQITAAANHSGGGGKGQRHWIGDGVNNISGGLSLSFVTPQTEIWIRWYMRFEQGFIWNYLSGYKILYIDVQTHPFTIPYFQGWNMARVDVDGGVGYDTNGKGWDYVMRNGGTWITTSANGATPGESHKTGDGQWHLYEIHLKTDTNRSNGVIEFWIDQERVVYATTANWGGTLFTHFTIGENSKYPLNGRDMYVDYDDIAVSNTGPIGPTVGGGGNTVTPSKPTNVQVQ